MRPIKTFLKDPREITQGLVRKYFSSRIVDDRTYLSFLYATSFWKKMHWDNPKTFNEKMTWLKVYGRDPKYTTMVDKYAVKSLVVSLIGKEYVVDNYAVADDWNEIDWALMPDQFVIKCTHDSGGAFICKDKKTFDFVGIQKIIEANLNTYNYNIAREWPYKDVPHRIIVDRLLDDHTGNELRDYKFWCFNGKPTYMYCTVKAKQIYENFYDMDFHPVMIDHGFPRHQPEFERPECFDEMRRLAEKLASGIPFVRVDFFQVEGKVYFGEFTFFDWGAHRPFKGDWDRKLGEMIKLPV